MQIKTGYTVVISFVFSLWIIYEFKKSFKLRKSALVFQTLLLFFVPSQSEVTLVVCVVLQARMVAAATTTLCDAANAAVQGNASEERLIAGAKQVSNSTAQLLLACRVKADSNSESQRRLQV